MVTVIAAVTGIMLFFQVVIDTLTPKERLKHHPVAFRAVQFGRTAVRISVTGRIIQGVVCHLAILVVDNRVNIGHIYIAGRRLFRNLGQRAVTLFEDGGYMAVGNVCIAVFIAGQVVKVAHVSIICRIVIKLYHRILRLDDVQFRIMLPVCGVCILVHITGQSVCTDKSAGIGIVAAGIDTAGLHVLFKQRPVAFHVYAGNTYMLHVGTLRNKGLPVEAGAAGKHERRYIRVVPDGQTFRI